MYDKPKEIGWFNKAANEHSTGFFVLFFSSQSLLLDKLTWLL